ncbi:MAG: hypothetical protein J5956_12885 [Ruminococcus sp.]|nr:hypothetical protein [Ruminococcus sp.]
MKKQFISAIVSILAAAFMMTGCGSTADSVKDTGAAADSSQAQVTTVSTAESSQAETTTTAKQPAQAVTTTQAQQKPAQTTAQKAENRSAPAKTGRISDSYKKYKELKLSGEEKDKITTTDFCYIESDKYVLLMEKDLVIPGDLKKNFDAIINSLEKYTGLSYCPDSYDYTKTIDFARSKYGFNPWEGMDYGKKIPIELIVDRKDEGLISCACNQFVTLELNAMYTDELWNSVPSYRDNTSWKRYSFIDYHSVAHELTHAITERSASLTKIMAEGSADYYAKKVLGDLIKVKGMTKDMKRSLEVSQMLKWDLPEKITAANAEKVFLRDYSEISSADRGAEYRLGSEFCDYLAKTQGKDFMKRYMDAIKADPQLRNESRPNEGYRKEIMQKHIELFKKLFGKDVFTKFGRDYSKYELKVKL